jgi:hypothetical protein
MPHFTSKELVGVKPMGWGAEGVWKPVGLNDCFLFTRYGTGQFFKPHFDGHYKNLSNQLSIYSVTLYLNDIPNDAGGDLIFYEGTRTKHEEVCRWHPRQGSVVIFQHDVLHEGEQIHKEGVYKYIARTSVMFERVADLSSALCFDPKFLKMKDIFARFDYFRAAEDPELFTRKFLEAQELQLEGGRTTWQIEDQPFFCGRDILANVLTQYLTIQALCRLSQTCKAWFLDSRSGLVWHILYMRFFGAKGAAIVNPLEMPNEAIDWYGAFSARATVSQKISPAVFHMSNLSWSWWRDFRKKPIDRSRVDFEYDGWDAGIKNWWITHEGDTEIEFWWGGDWYIADRLPNPYRYNTPEYERWTPPPFTGEVNDKWLSGSPGARLSQKLVPADPEYRNSSYPLLFSNIRKLPVNRTVLVDVIWPHWFCHPDSKSKPSRKRKSGTSGKPVRNSVSVTRNWDMVSDYSRGLEYVEEILPEIIRQKNPPAMSLLEAGAAGLLSENLSSGTVLCLSLHGALLVYRYQDLRPEGNPELFEIFTWDELLLNEDARSFALNSGAQIIMCDIDYLDAERNKLETLSFPSVRRFPTFLEDQVMPSWREMFVKAGKPIPTFVRQRGMMQGAVAFAESPHLVKSFVHVSEKLGGRFSDLTEKQFYAAEENPEEACEMYARRDHCSDWPCKLPHVAVCPELLEKGSCQKDPLLCPWPHPVLKGPIQYVK